MAQPSIRDAYKYKFFMNLPEGFEIYFYNSASVVFNNKIHILGGGYKDSNTNYYTIHYSWDGTEWTEESTLPYNFTRGFAVVYDGKIHILGSALTNTYTKHYSWDGTEWTEESTLPYDFYQGSAVVYDGKIHILGSNSSGNYTKHYSWDGTSWTEESTLPYSFYNGSAVVYDNKIHILGSGNSGNYTKHYSWDGTSWTEESTLPYNFYQGSAVVYDNKIHILGSYASGNTANHYSWDGTEWAEENSLLCAFYQGSAVIYDGKIHILGSYASGSSSSSSGTTRYNYYKIHYSWDGESWIEEVKAPYFHGFYDGMSVYFNNKLHFISGNCICVFNDLNSEPEIKVVLKGCCIDGGVVVYDGKIHILGSYWDTDNYRQSSSYPAPTYSYKHYSWDGSTLITETSLPFAFYGGSAVVYDGKIHILGSANNRYRNYHYSWDGTEWTEESTLPYSLCYGSAVVYDNKIHILGGVQNGTEYKHYSWDGTEWTEESTLPYSFEYGCAFVLSNKIHVIGGQSNAYINHYSWDGTNWKQELDLPFEFSRGSVTLINNLVYLLGGEQNPTKSYYICYFVDKGINKVDYGDENGTLIDLTEDDIINESQIPKGLITHTRSGKYIMGSRPVYYKVNSSRKALICRQELKTNPSSTSGTVVNQDAFILGGQIIKLRTTGGSTTVQLVSRKSDGVTESIVTLLTATSGFLDKCYIRAVHYYTDRWVVIEHYNYTSAVAKTAYGVRSVLMKTDGTLSISAAWNWTAASTATTDTDAIFIRSLENCMYAFMMARIVWNLSAGTVMNGGYRCYSTWISGTMTSNSTLIWGNTSNYYANSYINDKTVAPWLGGVFFRYNNTEYLVTYMDYSGSARVYTLTVNCADMAEIGALGHHYLGMTKSGLVVTVKEEDKLYLWSLDNTSTSNIYTKIAQFGADIFDRLSYSSRKLKTIIPYTFFRGSAVVYNDQIYILGGLNGSTSVATKFYVGSNPFGFTVAWTAKTAIPYEFYNGGVVVYDDKIHILGGGNGTSSSGSYKYHYAWNGSAWASISTLPYEFSSNNQAVVYNNKIHILGSSYSTAYTKHYSWDGTEWTEESTLPYNFYQGSAVVYDNKIHILGSYYSTCRRNHYSWDGTEWTEESTLPYDFYQGSAVVYDGKIHILGSNDSSNRMSHYSWNGTSWTEENTLPYDFCLGAALVYNNCINLLGGGQSETANTTTAYYSIKQNRFQILSFVNDVLLLSDKRRFQVTLDKLVELEPVEEITYAQYPPDRSYFGPESDPWEGVFIYGD